MNMQGLAGLDLPARWAGRDEFVILQAGFGRGQRFLTAWAAWRADPDRCQRLVYIALDAQPGAPEGLNDQSDAAPMQAAVQLANAWPVTTPGLHTLNFDEGPASGVTLLLGVGLAADLVPQLVARIDAFDLEDLASSPEAMHRDQPWLSRLGRLAAPGATATIPAQADAAQAEHLRANLRQSGFMFTPGARFQPRHTPAPLAGGLWPTTVGADERHALVIGAGLAGCAAAWALARQGWRCTVIDAHEAPAQGASGNPGGLFHSIVHGEDGIHARAHRAAALRTAAVVAPWLAQDRFAGQAQGLLRLDTDTSAAAAQALAQRLALPPDHVQWLGPEQAAQVAGIPVPSGGWLFKQGGWLDPAGYARALLDDARTQANVQFLGGQQVERLARTTHGQGQGEQSEPPLWQALDKQGQVIAQAAVVVLASANDTLRLSSALDGAATLPLSPTRGQLSSLPLGDQVRAPKLPVAGTGYVLPAHGGRLLFGATTSPDDPDTAMREADHRHNLAQATQLGSVSAMTQDALPPGLQGRVGWRATTPDRLPYVGPLPLAALPAPLAGKPAPRGDQPRFVPRLRDAHGGVYVLTGLGSRGITWAALAGELLASWVTGSPSPVEASLRDALDPARVVTRARARDNQADASA